MKRRIFVALIVLGISALLAAQDLHPHPWRTDRAFLAAVAFDAATTGLDGWATTGCSIERWSPWLYGRHIGSGRVAAVSAIQLAGEVGAAVWLRRRGGRWGRWMAVAGLVGAGGGHLAGGLHDLVGRYPCR